MFYSHYNTDNAPITRFCYTCRGQNQRVNSFVRLRIYHLNKIPFSTIKKQKKQKTKTKTNKQINKTQKRRRKRKEGNVLFNAALNTFYLWLYGVEHMVMYHSAREESRCRHMGYTQDSFYMYHPTYRIIHTGTRNSSMGPL